MIEEQINAGGGIKGRKIKSIIIDTQADLTKTKMAVRRLIGRALWLSLGKPLLVDTSDPARCQ
jgi:ABC-type branched-subunit amino acid transport system substrate-binding protein